MEPVKVTIHWMDAKSFGNKWMSIDELEELVMHEASTEGWLVKETSYGYMVAQSICGEEYHNILVIPKIVPVKEESND